MKDSDFSFLTVLIIFSAVTAGIAYNIASDIDNTGWFFTALAILSVGCGLFAILLATNSATDSIKEAIKESMESKKDSNEEKASEEDKKN